MSQADKARRFAELHVKGDPVVLYNIWDAGSTQAVEKAGAKAIATGSWSVAAAQGFPDGQGIPLDLVLRTVESIAGATALPVTIDFEGGYAEDPAAVADNVTRLIGAGAVGLNFEDQVLGGSGLHEIGRQAERIGAIRKAADGLGIPVVINARTDLFLKEKDPAAHGALMAEAETRAVAYQEAGAGSFFVPGLVDEGLIGRICAASDLPVNVMMKPGVPSLANLKSLGVGRVSYGPGPYVSLMKALEDAARAAYGQV